MQTLQTISCEEIMSTPIAPIPFSVENLLGQGLYLCLEDNKVRLQNRLYELTNEPTDSLYFSLLANTIGDGLEQQIEQFYLAHRDLKIVVIDTLQKIRSSEESAYRAGVDGT